MPVYIIMLLCAQYVFSETVTWRISRKSRGVPEINGRTGLPIMLLRLFLVWVRLVFQQRRQYNNNIIIIISTWCELIKRDLMFVGTERTDTVFFSLWISIHTRMGRLSLQFLNLFARVTVFNFPLVSPRSMIAATSRAMRTGYWMKKISSDHTHASTLVLEIWR